MPDACYYSLIERDDDGRFVGWVPDLPGATAVGPTEDAVLHELSCRARLCLHEMVLTGRPFPDARPADALPASEGSHRQRRLLLILG